MKIFSDILSRRVDYQSNDYKVSATRYRDSEGTASIILKVRDVEFVFSNRGPYGDAYEMFAREVCDVLEAACDNSCPIPDHKPKKR